MNLIINFKNIEDKNCISDIHKKIISSYLDMDISNYFYISIIDKRKSIFRFVADAMEMEEGPLMDLKRINVNGINYFVNSFCFYSSIYRDHIFLRSDFYLEALKNFFINDKYMRKEIKNIGK